MLTLNIEKREEKGKKLEKKRVAGMLPAVFYGPKEETVSIYVKTSDFLKTWKEAGESTVISLEGVGDGKEAIIHEVSVHPVTDAPVHVDFYIIEKGKKVEVEVPLEFVGESPAVKSLGGTLVKVLHEVSIEALPKDLPQEIEVDISALSDFEKHIVAGDLKIPDGVTLLTDVEETIALVQEPKEEEEEEPAVEFDESMVEVEKKGKEEGEEGDEGAEEASEKKEG